MSQDTLDVANRELREWRRKLEETEAYKKVLLWEAVIHSYGGSIPIHNNAGGIRKRAPSNEIPIIPNNAKKTQKDQVEGLTAECIRQNGGFAHLAKIKVYLEEHGVKTKIALVSWYLSQNKEMFVANRSKGWSLKK